MWNIPTTNYCVQSCGVIVRCLSTEEISLSNGQAPNKDKLTIALNSAMYAGLELNLEKNFPNISRFLENQKNQGLSIG